MSAISIGIQTVTPQTGTSPQSTPTQQTNKREADNAPIEAKQSESAPPPPGQGKFVDKHV
jgi:hypothetical protein